MSRTTKLFACLLLIGSLIASETWASAILYQEAVDGDLNNQTLLMGVGENVIEGSRIYSRRITNIRDFRGSPRYDTVEVAADYDNFKFEIAANQALTGIAFDFFDVSSNWTSLSSGINARFGNSYLGGRSWNVTSGNQGTLFLSVPAVDAFLSNAGSYSFGNGGHGLRCAGAVGKVCTATWRYRVRLTVADFVPEPPAQVPAPLSLAILGLGLLPLLARRRNAQAS